jgi:hypothetical protein
MGTLDRANFARRKALVTDAELLLLFVREQLGFVRVNEEYEAVRRKRDQLANAGMAYLLTHEQESEQDRIGREETVALLDRELAKLAAEHDAILQHPVLKAAMRLLQASLERVEVMLRQQNKREG